MNAFIAGFQVGLELFETRPGALKLRVRHSYLAHSLTGAASIGGQQNVAETADVAEVDFHAASDLQSSIQRFDHNDHLALGTLGAEHLRVAVVAAVHT